MATKTWKLKWLLPKWEQQLDSNIGEWLDHCHLGIWKEVT